MLVWLSALNFINTLETDISYILFPLFIISHHTFDTLMENNEFF